MFISIDNDSLLSNLENKRSRISVNTKLHQREPTGKTGGSIMPERVHGSLFSAATASNGSRSEES